MKDNDCHTVDVKVEANEKRIDGLEEWLKRHEDKCDERQRGIHSKFDGVNDRIDGLGKTVYTGLGIVMALTVLVELTVMYLAGG